jgi:hypothetical protein
VLRQGEEGGYASLFVRGGASPPLRRLPRWSLLGGFALLSSDGPYSGSSLTRPGRVTESSALVWLARVHPLSSVLNNALTHLGVERTERAGSSRSPVSAADATPAAFERLARRH